MLPILFRKNEILVNGVQQKKNSTHLVDVQICRQAGYKDHD